jgi:peptidoglycan/xylan/chitin deacetylase (PgdA/CDA1 family)
VIGRLAGVVAVAWAGPSVVAIGPLRRQIFPRLAGIGDLRHVALTFDDGPHPVATPRLLRLLDAADIRATFFLLGRAAEQHPGIVRSMVDAGHEVGVHGYDHRLLLKRGPRDTAADLTRATEVIAALSGHRPRWWRPPYGVATTPALHAARRLNLQPVWWTCWGRDWTATATGDSVFRAVRRRLAGGGTILLHDSDHAAAPGAWQAMYDALPAILSMSRARGYTVGPLRDHGLVVRPSEGPR